MKILSFGIYSKQPEYPRHRNLIEGLKSNGVEVIECSFHMTASFKERLQSARSFWGRVKYSIRLILSYLFLAMKFFQAQRVDAILVGYPGYFHVRFVRFLQLVKNRKAVLVYDIFFSLYDALVWDRKILSEKNLLARLLHAIEKDACRAAGICLIDTDPHGDYISREFSVPREKIKRVFVGPTFPVFKSAAIVRKDGVDFNVLFIGTYIPLHGLDTILAAAGKLTEHHEILFTLVGTGQLREEMETRAKESRLRNVRFLGWGDRETLVENLRSCDLALGIFGTTEKAARVIPIKVFDICAAGVPFITADTPAIRQCFRHGENAFLVPPGNSRALADAILVMKADRDLREKTALGAHGLAETIFSTREMGRELMRSIENRKSGVTHP